MLRIYLVLALGLIVIGGVTATIILQTPRSSSERTEGSSIFSGSLDGFAFLNSPSSEKTAPSVTTSADATQIENLIRTWNETRAVEVPTSYLSLSTLSTNTDPTSETQPIEVLLSSLLGESTLSALQTQTYTTSSGGDSTGYDTIGTLWDGTYTRGTNTAIITPAKNATALQQSLHDYANEIGLLLNRFTDGQGDQSAVFDAYFADRSNATQILRLQKLTENYTSFSAQLNGVTPPDVLLATHTNLVEGYRNAGIYLWNIRLADSDTAFVERLLAYNVIAEDIAHAHISVIKTLRAYDVTFAPGEAGNAFVFSGAGGLSSDGL